MRRVELLRREISKPRPIALQLAIVAGAVAVAALVRLVLDRGTFGIPFVTFAPVILVIAIVLRWRMACLAAALSMLLILVVLHLVPLGSSGGHPAAVIVAMVLTSAALIYIGDTLHVAIQAIEEQRLRFETYNAELQHRSMNALQIIQALLSQAPKAADPNAFYKALSGRIAAMATANRLLGPGQLQTWDLRQLIVQSIKPFPSERFELAGPDCDIGAKSGTRLVMALHELGTNAIKYGSLSNDEGRVTIRWTREATTIEIHWQEHGGPEVQPRNRKGLGSTILAPSDGLPVVDLAFKPSGLECRMQARFEEDAAPAKNRAANAVPDATGSAGFGEPVGNN